MVLKMQKTERTAESVLLLPVIGKQDTTAHVLVLWQRLTRRF
jgi:hypothetical protein